MPLIHRSLVVLTLAGWSLVAPAGHAAEDYDGLPEGPGREEVYYTCQACHSLAIVKQQGLNRASWEETLVWMVEEQGMPEPTEEELDLMLDYLSTYFGRDRAAAQ